MTDRTYDHRMTFPADAFDLTRPCSDRELALINELARYAVPRTLALKAAAAVATPGPDLVLVGYEAFCAYRGESVEEEFVGETVVIDNGESWLLDEWLAKSKDPRQD